MAQLQTLSVEADREMALAIMQHVRTGKFASRSAALRDLIMRGLRCARQEQEQA